MIGVAELGTGARMLTSFGPSAWSLAYEHAAATVESPEPVLGLASPFRPASLLAPPSLLDPASLLGPASLLAPASLLGPVSITEPASVLGPASVLEPASGMGLGGRLVGPLLETAESYSDTPSGAPWEHADKTTSRGARVSSVADGRVPMTGSSSAPEPILDSARDFFLADEGSSPLRNGTA
jgi:hypothetical protein